MDVKSSCIEKSRLISIPLALVPLVHVAEQGRIRVGSGRMGPD